MAHALFDPALFGPTLLIRSNRSAPVCPMSFAQFVLIEGHNQASGRSAASSVFVSFRSMTRHLFSVHVMRPTR